jgi:hypothetical protein
LKKESKLNLSKSIINANKDLNSENISSNTTLANSKTKNNFDSVNDYDNDSVVSTPANSDYESDNEANKEANTDYMLKIDTLNNDKIDVDLNIESLDDVNKIDLDISDLKSNISDDEDLALDIQELPK